MTRLPKPQTRNAAFLPMAGSQGHPAAGSGENDTANTGVNDVKVQSEDTSMSVHPTIGQDGNAD